MSNPAITSTPALNLHLASFGAANTRPHGSMTIAGRTVDVREIAGDIIDDCCEAYLNCCRDVVVFIGNGCYNFLNIIGVVPVVSGLIDITCSVGNGLIDITCSVGNIIDQAITSFLHDREVDCQLFKLAFISMGNGATPEDIKLNIEALARVRNHLQVSERLQTNDIFIGHEPCTDALLHFHFSQETIIRYGQLNDAAKQRLEENFRHEIIRACNAAIFFQRTLRVVNTFYNTFGINSHWVNQVFFESNPTTPNGTVRYNPEGIPLSIIGKAKQIETLKGKFDQLEKLVNTFGQYEDAECEEAKNVLVKIKELVDQLGCKEEEVLQANFFDMSGLYTDYMLQIMTIPVFDPKHSRDIQDQFSTATQAAIAAGTASIASDDRTKRHALDWRSYESQFQAERRFGVRCSNCRNDIERENMLIDTDLQDDILNSLMTKLPKVFTKAAQP